MDDLETSEDGIHFLIKELRHFKGERSQIDRVITTRRNLMKGGYKEKYQERYLVALLLYVGYYSAPLPLKVIGQLYGVKKQRVIQMVTDGLRLLMWEELWNQ